MFASILGAAKVFFIDGHLHAPQLAVTTQETRDVDVDDQQREDTARPSYHV